MLDPILIYSYSCLRADALPWDMTGDSLQAMVRCAARQHHSDRPCALHSTVPTQHTQCDTGHKAALCPVSQAFAEPHSQTTTLYVRMPPQLSRCVVYQYFSSILRRVIACTISKPSASRVVDACFTALALCATRLYGGALVIPLCGSVAYPVPTLLLQLARI